MKIQIKHKQSKINIHLDYKGSYVDVRAFLKDIIGTTIDKINTKK